MAEKLTDEQKYNYIKDKYGEKANVILQKYGAKAYDIDKNFDKYYNDKVFLGRNFWMDPKKSAERAKEGKENRALFEQGKLPLDEAARIINCPAYLGTMQYTVNKISTEIKVSAKRYNDTKSKETQQKPKAKSPQTKPAAEKQVTPEKTSQKTEEKKPNTQTKAKETKTDKKQTKSEMKNQRTVAKVKEEKIAAASVILDDVVVVAPSLQKESMTKLGVKLAMTPDMAKAKLDSISQPKTPAERKYDEMLAKKTANMPEILGREASEIGLTIGDLIDIGVDPFADFQAILKSMDKDAAAKLIPEKGFEDEAVVVSKELAIAAIARVQIREAQKNRGKERA